MKRQILLLRGLAILAVVANHATGWAFVAMFWWTHRYAATSVPDYGQMGSLAYWILMAINQAALFSVPAFLMISGLSAGYSVGAGPLASDWRVVRSRLGSLLGPYLVWSLIVIGIDAALGVVLSPAEYALRILEGRATEAYYFVPLLAQFYILSPLVVRGARSVPWVLLGTAAAVQMVGVLFPYVAAALSLPAELGRALDLPGWLFLRWPLYYALGAVVGTHPRCALQVFGRYRTALLACAAVLAALTLVESEILWRATAEWDWARGSYRVTSTLYALTFVLSALTWRVTPSSLTRAVERAGAMSYGIYLMHPKALELGARAIYHVAPELLARQVVFALLLFAIPLSGCWLAMALVARSPARRVYHYVFG